MSQHASQIPDPTARPHASPALLPNPMRGPNPFKLGCSRPTPMAA